MLHVVNSFNDLLNQGAAHAWLFIPTAIILGALHGLEPGHSKTMMAAFIVAIKGTVAQAVLLGTCAAISHSLVIWLLAAAALHYGSQWDMETSGPYFQMVSAFLIIVMAGWMFWRTRKEQIQSSSHSHNAEGPHGGPLMNTGHGFVEISVFETDEPPRFRIYFFDENRIAKLPKESDSIAIETVRVDGTKQTFAFEYHDGFLQAKQELPEPHEFDGKLLIRHGDHAHTYLFSFKEHEHHHHHEGLNVSDAEYQDAHERAHAAGIARRFANRNVTTPQIIFFGLTGGLLPCPAAFTILLICLQLKKFTLGFALVASFSIGLALTMIATGAIAAWSVQHAARRFKGFGELARKAPYFSSALLIVMGLVIGFEGWRHLH